MIGLVNVPLTGGVDVFHDPTRIDDDKLQLSQNITSRIGEFVGMRNSMTYVREAIPSVNPWCSATFGIGAVPSSSYFQWAKVWRPVRAMFDLNGDVIAILQAVVPAYIRDKAWDTNYSSYVTRQIGAGEFFLTKLPGSIVSPPPVSGANILLDGVALGNCGSCPSLFMFGGIVYAIGGTGGGGMILPDSTYGNTNGWIYQHITWNTAQQTGFFPDGGAPVRDRVVYWRGNKIWYSDRGVPLTIGANAEQDWYIPVTNEEQEPITAVSELSTTADGSPMQSVAAVFTKNRCFLLLGEPIQTIDDKTNGTIGSLQINRLNIEAGCVSAATIVRTTYGTFWAGMDDVWFMPYGSLPIRVGTNIRSVLKAQPAHLSWRLCAGYMDGFYRLATFADGQGPDRDSPLAQQWWLDVNDGAPDSYQKADWWGPMTMTNGDVPVYGSNTKVSGMFTFLRDTRPAGDGKLYSLQPYRMTSGQAAYGGDPTDIYGMTLVGWDANRGRDVGCPNEPVRAWQAATTYFVGDKIYPPGYTSGFLTPGFICTTSGVSSGAEPNWYAAGAGSSVADGTVVWSSIYSFTDGVSTYQVLSARQSAPAQGNNETSWQLVSKEYLLDDPMVEKMLDGIELAFWAQSGLRLDYSTQPEQQSNTRIVGPTGDQLGINTFDSSGQMLNPQRIWQRKLLTSPAGMRFASQSAEAWITAVPGIIIVAGYNDTFSYNYNGVAQSVTIGAGFYANLPAVWNALSAALAAAGTPLRSTIDADSGILNRCRVGIGAGTAGPTFSLNLYTPLAMLFGYTPDEAAGYGSTVYPNYIFGNDNPYNRQLADCQLAGINIRMAKFGRRPM